MQRIKTYIGFAIKSGAVIKGLDDILRSRKKIALILASDVVKDNSMEKIQNYTKVKQIPLQQVNQSVLDELNLTGVKIMGITDPNLANAIIKEFNN